MQSSPQVMQMLAAPVAAKAEAKNAKLPLLSLLTFSPLGNPLSGLSAGQCNLFFDYLLLSLHNQRKEQLERAAALNKKIVLPAALSAAAMRMNWLSSEQKVRQAQFGEEMKKAEEKKAQQEKIAVDARKGDEEAKRKKDESGSDGGAAGAASAISAEAKAAGTQSDSAAIGGEGVAGWKVSSLFKKRDEKKGGESGAPGSASPSAMGQKNEHAPSLPEFSSTYGHKAEAVSGAIEQMAPVIDDYARGNAAKEKKVVGNLHGSLRATNYATDDLMASLLMVIEDDAWSGEESGLGSAKPHGGATRLTALVPQKLRSTAQDSAVVRLASVREMLRYYFRMHPKDYHVALASALGITSDQEEDSTFLQERLAFELASIGSFALAQKLLAEVKLKKKLDTKECLVQLGYRYDVRKKRLVLGKRTCGKPAEARGIIALLLASARK